MSYDHVHRFVSGVQSPTCLVCGLPLEVAVSSPSLVCVPGGGVAPSAAGRSSRDEAAEGASNFRL